MKIPLPPKRITLRILSEIHRLYIVLICTKTRVNFLFLLLDLLVFVLCIINSKAFLVHWRNIFSHSVLDLHNILPQFHWHSNHQSAELKWCELLNAVFSKYFPHIQTPEHLSHNSLFSGLKPAYFVPWGKYLNQLASGRSIYSHGLLSLNEF